MPGVTGMYGSGSLNRSHRTDMFAPTERPRGKSENRPFGEVRRRLRGVTRASLCQFVIRRTYYVLRKTGESEAIETDAGRPELPHRH